MYKLVLINDKNERFIKIFDNDYLLNKFLNKVKRGKKLKISAIIKY